jgi:hypothetical protein
MSARVLAAALALALAACGRPQQPVGLRFQKGQKLVYTVRDVEEAPHPTLGFGGRITTEARVEMSVLDVDPDGTANVEAKLAYLKVEGTSASGIQVDTDAKRPLAGDRIGSNSVALALVPTTGIVRIHADARVEGAANRDIAAHLARWSGPQPLAAQPVIQRMAERIDPVLVAQAAFGSVEQVLWRDPKAPEGEAWRISLPVVQTPAGPIRARATVTWTRAPDVIEMAATGVFALEGPPADDVKADFVSGTIELYSKFDPVRGAFTFTRDKSRLLLRARDAARTEAYWTRDHVVRLLDGAGPK